MRLTVPQGKTLRGELQVPSDKSLTHRALMFGAVATGESIVRSPLRGEDCMSTLRCLNQLGLRHEWIESETLRLIPTAEWTQPKSDLDCGNSGTTMRLLAGLVASRPINVRMTGDHSLSRRPMKRIAEPLRLMGATFDGESPPLTIQGAQLTAIEYHSPVASAQIKSCILLAGLRATGKTILHEPSPSRDHTERMLTALGVHLNTENGISMEGGQSLSPFTFTVPGDISSAAFAMVGTAIQPGSEVTFRRLGMNPSRTGILDVFTRAGIPWEASNSRLELGEPVADVIVTASGHIKPFVIEGAMVPRLIDEIPVLALLATQAEGRTVIRDAKELRVKESDRIAIVAEALTRMGAKIEATEDGFIIDGPTRLTGTTVNSDGDHRIAMTFTVAGLIADGSTEILGAESILTSYPNFESDLRGLLHE